MKTLSDKAINFEQLTTDKGIDGCHLKVEDVKESIKNIRAELKDPKLDCWDIDKIIDKHVGKGLI